MSEFPKLQRRDVMVGAASLLGVAAFALDANPATAGKTGHPSANSLPVGPTKMSSSTFITPDGVAISTRIGATGRRSLSFFTMAGRCPAMIGMRKCCSSYRTGIA